MLIFEFIVAVVAVGLVAARPRNMTVALGVLGLAGLELAVGAVGVGELGSAFVSVGPAVAFLWAVMTLAVLAERSGLADGLAAGLIAAGRGSTLRLFCLVCAACAMLTAALSLDGAVVVMAPVLLALRRRGVPQRPLLLGTVAVANAFSAALPAGNPTNLVVMDRLALAPAAGRGLTLGTLPLRVGAQVAGLLLVLEALPHPSLAAGSLPALLAIAG